MTKIKLASTIILCRDYKNSLEVLLVKRNKALAFAGGLWVFPGGKIDKNELAHCTDELAAAKLAAVRELKEETNLNIDRKELLFFRHWTTPVNEPRRYATYFFFGSIDNNVTEVIIDDSEIKDFEWITPQKALDKLIENKMSMMLPTILSLQFIRKCKTVKEAKTLILKEKPIFTLPVIQIENGKIISLFEGDAGYDSGIASTKGARHRFTIDITARSFNFEFHDCAEGIVPINGGMHL